MALARYTDQFWFPSSALAANIQARVFPEGSNTLASLFTDSTGSTALPNPLATTSSGVLTFWAEAGNYWVHLDSETFLVTVGMSQEQADLSTGVASGGRLSVNAMDPAAVDISAMDGYIVNYLAGTQAEPAITRVKTVDQTVSLDAAALLRTVTWWLVDSSGTVIQQATKPTNPQFRTHIVLGVTGFVGGSIVNILALPVILPGQGNQLVELIESLGPFNVSGNAITANGANLMLDHASGTLFSRSFNHFDGPTLTNDPHVATTTAQSPASFTYATQATTTFPSPVTLVDPANFDSGGVITPVGGGSNRSTVQRIYLFPVDATANQLLILYGQATYASLSEAVAAVSTEDFTPNPAVGAGGVFIASIALIRTATDLSDPAQASIVRAGKFATP